ncbi:ABC transporter permease [Alloscardovia venturai]|uniref:ABC transporter permease n=1 Tax=Alloscardovia venturai TaxID=1769421 RepID=A0ABW2Y587_9BIFI
MPKIAKSILRRLALFILMLWIVSVVIFLALRVLPGDVAAVVAGTNATRAQYRALRASLGVDKPLIVQYLSWMGNVLSGNLGVSTLTGQSMGARIASRALLTFPLIVLSMIFALVCGITSAVYSLTSARAWVRQSLRAISVALGAVPALWAGLLLIMLFGKGSGLIGILPTQGFARSPLESWSSLWTACASLILPALSVGIITAAQIMRYTRSALVEVADSDYVTWSMAAGMTRAQALRTTGLRLAAPQILSVSGITFATMVTGVLTVESLFALPGLATLLLSDVSQRDLPAVQTELLLLAAFFLLVGFVVDVVGQMIDPRLRSTGDDVYRSREVVEEEAQ